MSLSPLSNSTDFACLACGTAGLSVLYELKQVPKHSVLLLASRDEALNYPKGDIALGYCPACGFISNVSFTSEHQEYLSSRYEATQSFSATFNTFHQNLAWGLIERFHLYGKHIIEIGCGQGEFLTLLCELGDNYGLGFDPAYIKERGKELAPDRIRFVKDFYSEQYSDCYADFVCCKMTLEHIPQVADFVSMVRRSMGDRMDTLVFFQVPDVRRILREIAFWDIYYEHCSYFSLEALAGLFYRCGFEVINLSRAYDDQYLMLEARPRPVGAVSGQPDYNLAELRQDVLYFAENYQARLGAWQQVIAEISQGRQRAVLWGGGSKAVAFLTTLGIVEEIKYAVDINPRKQNMYLAGTGQQVVAPEFLKEYRPDKVIVMNPIYCREIKRDLAQMGVSAELRPLE